jgi:uncharacterized protein
MRTLFVALMVGVLMSMPLTGAASANSAGPVPSGSAAFTKNPIYKTGKFTSQTCEEPGISGGHFDSVELYFENMSECLDRAWGPQLKKAGIRYSKPKVKVTYGSQVKTACGTYHLDDVFSMYCKANQTVYVMVAEYGVRNELDSPRMLESLSIGYGYHVQRLIGVLPQETRAAKTLSKAGAVALSSKVSLQNICFVGASIGSVWDSLGHSKAHGSGWFIGQHSMEGETKGNGTFKNRVYWETRGFNAESPDVCNTFNAPASKVA